MCICLPGGPNGLCGGLVNLVITDGCDLLLGENNCGGVAIESPVLSPASEEKIR